MSKRREGNGVVEGHTIWAVGAGLVPVPMFDLVTVTAIQMDMLRQLASLYEVEYTKELGKIFVAAITSTTVSRLGARVGSSLLKAIPGIGSALGSLSVSAMSGASTFALGQATIRHLEEGNNFMEVDTDRLKRSYRDAYERGREFVSSLGENRETSQHIFQSLKHLEELKSQGVITEDEFAAKKAEILNRI